MVCSCSLISKTTNRKLCQAGNSSITGGAQRPHQHVVGGLLATELFSLAALLRENHNLTVAGPAGAAHALDRADGVDDVEEYDQVHARDVEALLPDGCGHQGVEGAVAESVEDVALLLLGLAPGSPGVAGARGDFAKALDFRQRALAKYRASSKRQSSSRFVTHLFRVPNPAKVCYAPFQSTKPL